MPVFLAPSQDDIKGHTCRPCAHPSHDLTGEPWESRYVPEPNTGCFLWLRATNGSGYGICTFRGKSMIATRVAWILEYGSIDPALHVLHRCDTPSCVNPAHLFLGTNNDNVKDAVSKRRSWWFRRPSLSPETRSKISAAGIGRVPSAETRMKLRKAHAGRVFSPETRRKMSLSATGKIVSAETRAKMSASHRGKVFTAEHRRRISEAQKRPKC